MSAQRKKPAQKRARQKRHVIHVRRVRFMIDPTRKDFENWLTEKYKHLLPRKQRSSD